MCFRCAEYLCKGVQKSGAAGTSLDSEFDAILASLKIRLGDSQPVVRDWSRKTLVALREMNPTRIQTFLASLDAPLQKQLETAFAAKPVAPKFASSAKAAPAAIAASKQSSDSITAAGPAPSAPAQLGGGGLKAPAPARAQSAAKFREFLKAKAAAGASPVKAAPNPAAEEFFVDFGAQPSQSSLSSSSSDAPKAEEKNLIQLDEQFGTIDFDPTASATSNVEAASLLDASVVMGPSSPVKSAPTALVSLASQEESLIDLSLIAPSPARVSSSATSSSSADVLAMSPLAGLTNVGSSAAHSPLLLKSDTPVSAVKKFHVMTAEKPSSEAGDENAGPAGNSRLSFGLSPIKLADRLEDMATINHGRLSSVLSASTRSEDPTVVLGHSDFHTELDFDDLHTRKVTLTPGSPLAMPSPGVGLGDMDTQMIGPEDVGFGILPTPEPTVTISLAPSAIIFEDTAVIKSTDLAAAVAQQVETAAPEGEKPELSEIKAEAEPRELEGEPSFEMLPEPAFDTPVESAEPVEQMEESVIAEVEQPPMPEREHAEVIDVQASFEEPVQPAEVETVEAAVEIEEAPVAEISVAVESTAEVAHIVAVSVEASAAEFVADEEEPVNQSLAVNIPSNASFYIDEEALEAEVDAALAAQEAEEEAARVAAAAHDASDLIEVSFEAPVDGVDCSFSAVAGEVEPTLSWSEVPAEVDVVVFQAAMPSEETTGIAEEAVLESEDVAAVAEAPAGEETIVAAVEEPSITVAEIAAAEEFPIIVAESIVIVEESSIVAEEFITVSSDSEEAINASDIATSVFAIKDVAVQSPIEEAIAESDIDHETAISVPFGPAVGYKSETEIELAVQAVEAAPQQIEIEEPLEATIEYDGNDAAIVEESAAEISVAPAETHIISKASETEPAPQEAADSLPEPQLEDEVLATAVEESVIEIAVDATLVEAETEEVAAPEPAVDISTAPVDETIVFTAQDEELINFELSAAEEKPEETSVADDLVSATFVVPAVVEDIETTTAASGVEAAAFGARVEETPAGRETDQAPAAVEETVEVEEIEVALEKNKDVEISESPVDGTAPVEPTLVESEPVVEVSAAALAAEESVESAVEASVEIAVVESVAQDPAAVVGEETAALAAPSVIEASVTAPPEVEPAAEVPVVAEGHATESAEAHTVPEGKTEALEDPSAPGEPEVPAAIVEGAPVASIEETPKDSIAVEDPKEAAASIDSRSEEEEPEIKPRGRRANSRSKITAAAAPAPRRGGRRGAAAAAEEPAEEATIATVVETAPEPEAPKPLKRVASRRKVAEPEPESEKVEELPVVAAEEPIAAPRGRGRRATSKSASELPPIAPSVAEEKPAEEAGPEEKPTTKKAAAKRAGRGRSVSTEVIEEIKSAVLEAPAPAPAPVAEAPKRRGRPVRAAVEEAPVAVTKPVEEPEEEEEEEEKPVAKKAAAKRPTRGRAGSAEVKEASVADEEPAKPAARGRSRRSTPEPVADPATEIVKEVEEPEPAKAAAPARGRGRRAPSPVPEPAVEETVSEEEPTSKPAARGRGRRAASAEPEPEVVIATTAVPPDPAPAIAKGRPARGATAKTEKSVQVELDKENSVNAKLPPKPALPAETASRLKDGAKPFSPVAGRTRRDGPKRK